MCDTGYFAMVRGISDTGRVPHAVLMMIAWFVLSPFGSFLARQLKQQLGTPFWFLAHRAIQVCMILHYDGKILENRVDDCTCRTC